jgi:hypothetical protein
MASIGHLPSDGFKRTEADEDVNVVDEDVALLVCYLKFLLYYYSWIFFIELNADRS